MNKYFFKAQIDIVADTVDEARTILRNDPTPLAENSEITNEKYTERTVKGFAPWI